MIIRQTSIEAYKNLIESGKLAEKNSLVYKHLYVNGPTTQKKTERFFNDRTYTLRPRFAQLERMGLIRSVGVEKCEETGKRNMLWDVTDRVHPLKVDRQEKIDYEQKYKDLIQRARDRYQFQKGIDSNIATGAIWALEYVFGKENLIPKEGD